MAREINKFIPDDLVLVVNGQWSGTTDIYGDIRQILIQPPSEETVYDFSIRDDSGMYIFKRKGIVGSLITDNLRIVLFPGEKFLQIENSSNNGPFKLKIIYQA